MTVNGISHTLSVCSFHLGKTLWNFRTAKSALAMSLMELSNDLVCSRDVLNIFIQVVCTADIASLALLYISVQLSMITPYLR